MYLCDDCENKSGIFNLDGDSRCSKHGLTGFHIEPLEGLSCSICAKKAQRCQVCGCYVNAREYDEKFKEKYQIKNE
jgi:hypothetical protein